LVSSLRSLYLIRFVLVYLFTGSARQSVNYTCILHFYLHCTRFLYPHLFVLCI
jgi:hypothetical protein